jgi:pentose-5-phosphate-3-epimerase
MKEKEIIPAVLERTFGEVSNKLALVAGATRTVQLDICDGVFVPGLTWPFISPAQYDKTLNLDGTFRMMGEEKVEMPYCENFDFELDLMVQKAKTILPQLLSIGPVRIFFHAETFADLYTEVEELCRMMPTIVEPGIAINIDTDPSILFPLLDDSLVTSVQCMGIATNGKQGEPLDERVYAQIDAIHARYPHVPISVDGGVTLENASKLIKAGATRLVSGSAIFTAERVQVRINEFKKVIQ